MHIEARAGEAAGNVREEAPAFLFVLLALGFGRAERPRAEIVRVEKPRAKVDNTTRD